MTAKVSASVCSPELLRWAWCVWQYRNCTLLRGMESNAILETTITGEETHCRSPDGDDPLPHHWKNRSLDRGPRRQQEDY